MLSLGCFVDTVIVEPAPPVIDDVAALTRHRLGGLRVALERHADGNYYFATTTASFVSPTELAQLYHPVTPPVKDEQSVSPGFQLGGPGYFNIKAGSLDLGSSGGIISWGSSSDFNPINYGTLTPWTAAGAAVTIEAAVNADTAIATRRFTRRTLARVPAAGTRRK